MSLLAYAHELVQQEVNERVFDLPDFIDKNGKPGYKKPNHKHIGHSVSDKELSKDIEWADQSNLKQAAQTIVSSVVNLKTNQKTKPVKCHTLFSDIKSLRIINKPVGKLEPSLLKHFERLETLVLIDNNTNDLNDNDLRNLPSNLLTLTIQANNLMAVPQVSHLRNLTHLGLAYNQITRITPKGYGIFPALISLDLGFNRLDSLNQILDDLAECLLHRRLKLLVLSGNPACILKHYRPTIIRSMPRLMMLDDTTVSQDERKGKLSDTVSNSIIFQVQVGRLEIDSNLPTSCTDPAVLKEYLYSIVIDFAPSRSKARKTSTPTPPPSKPSSAATKSRALLKTDPMTIPNVDDKKQIQLDKSQETPVEVTLSLWDSLDAGLVVKLVQHCYKLVLPDKYKIDPKKAKKGGPLFPPEIAKRELASEQEIGKATLSLAAVQKGQRELVMPIELLSRDAETRKTIGKISDLKIVIQ